MLYDPHGGRETHAQKHARYSREWRRKNPEKVRASKRATYVRSKYGFELKEADAIRAQSCAICDAAGPNQIDHCHTTGAVRGPLCRSCNTVLGLMREDPARLRAAAAYIETHTEPEEILVALAG